MLPSNQLSSRNLYPTIDAAGIMVLFAYGSKARLIRVRTSRVWRVHICRILIHSAVEVSRYGAACVSTIVPITLTPVPDCCLSIRCRKLSMASLQGSLLVATSILEGAVNACGNVGNVGVESEIGEGTASVQVLQTLRPLSLISEVQQMMQAQQVCYQPSLTDEVDDGIDEGHHSPDNDKHSSVSRSSCSPNRTSRGGSDRPTDRPSDRRHEGHRSD